MVNTELCFKKSYHTFLNTVKLSIQFIFTIANTRSLPSLEICNGKYEIHAQFTSIQKGMVLIIYA